MDNFLLFSPQHTLSLPGCQDLTYKKKVTNCWFSPLHLGDLERKISGTIWQGPHTCWMRLPSRGCNGIMREGNAAIANHSFWELEKNLCAWKHVCICVNLQSSPCFCCFFWRLGGALPLTLLVWSLCSHLYLLDFLSVGLYGIFTAWGLFHSIIIQ